MLNIGNKNKDEGAKALSEMLKLNKTLTSLELCGEEGEKRKQVIEK